MDVALENAHAASAYEPSPSRIHRFGRERQDFENAQDEDGRGSERKGTIQILERQVAQPDAGRAW